MAASWLCSPRRREIRLLIPTPRPTDRAIISVCTGKARDTAVRASALYLATKMLSTTLYRACTSMEIIIGTEILGTSCFMGISPRSLERPWFSMMIPTFLWS